MDKRGWLPWVALTKNPLAAAILMPGAYDFLSGRVVASLAAHAVNSS